MYTTVYSVYWCILHVFICSLRVASYPWVDSTCHFSSSIDRLPWANLRAKSKVHEPQRSGEAAKKPQFLLMVQKSGDHQLRLVVYSTFYIVLYISGINSINQTCSGEKTIKHQSHSSIQLISALSLWITSFCPTHVDSQSFCFATWNKNMSHRFT